MNALSPGHTFNPQPSVSDEINFTPVESTLDEWCSPTSKQLLPLKPGDDLYPWDVRMVDGEQVVTIKECWPIEKEVALRLRTIEYLLQFPSYHRNAGVVAMIDEDIAFFYENATSEQLQRFNGFVRLRRTWEV
ncbi:hypothetical protein [Rhizobium sp. BR 315]|uniref:hypothetical protein n=1 Tax=Rhizobium sp. BR 315 TaxID=3040014 RepID=UPI003D32C1E0